MRYITVDDARRYKVNLDVQNIDVTGSVIGMQHRFGWKKGGQVRVGSYIYNVGEVEMKRCQQAGIVRG